MSLTTWCEEFYAIEATKVAKKDALKHSVTKWEGLMLGNRVFHNVGMSTEACDSCFEVYDKDDPDEILRIDADSCALCHWNSGINCKTCPLCKLRSGVPCDEDSEFETRAPYKDAVNGDVEPMLYWLRLAFHNELLLSHEENN